MATRIPLSLRGASQRSSHLFVTANRLTLTRAFTTTSLLAKSKFPPQSKASRLSRPSTTAQPIPEVTPEPAYDYSLHRQYYDNPTPEPKSEEPPKSNSEPQDLGTLLQQRRWPLLFSGLTALIMGAYISMLIASLSRGPDACSHVHPVTGQLPVTGRPRELDSLTSNPIINDRILREKAMAFDNGLNLPERMAGIRLLRKWLGTRVKGHVLEVAVGTGRNLQFYDWTDVVKGPVTGRELTEEEREEEENKAKERIRSVLDKGGKDGEKRDKDWVEKMKLPGSLEGEMLTFTGVDISEGMMGVARQRLRENVPDGRKLVPKGAFLASREGSDSRIGEGKRGEEQEVLLTTLEDRIRLVRADAEAKLPEAPAYPARLGDKDEEKKKYDTVVQTFGLCSVSDPLALLQNMAGVVKPDTGRIILLEHGKGWSDWINEKLDAWAPQHFSRYGCWWNRDIEKLVKEAEQKVPGLEVVKIERPGFFQAGTTVLVQLKVKSQGN
ncbi:S-adenosyl-L-methionine-dependent methyltransferase [Neurospora tetraspora]|uniref:S-adenosyl-L-methionine-dependent methyltransferase n=1 Tax=Neurospora tetraspora TaxID=94610 RepID=A0AAE0MQ66_9PEZI|nr:S-adenosyl-L-methionine-dependent methyltransferase [Neurospora tetraspora]